jgi:parvulin-like peptidyl-prolyl isomerase
MTARRIGLSMLGILILVVLGAVIWLYTGNFSEAKMKVFTKVALPAALVDNYPVSGKELMVRYAFAKGYFKDQPVEQSKLLNSVYQQFLDQKKLELVAKRVGVTVTNTQLEEQYKSLVAEQANGDEAALRQALEENYGFTLEDFKSKVLYIEQLQINLTTWYNSQKDLNSQTYKTAEGLLAQLKDGKAFADVAKAYTQDENGKAFDGDAGFITSKELLPEFQQQVETAALNTPIVVASRYGVHLINVSEKTGEGSETKYHVQQIFLKTAGIDGWLKTQMESIKTTNLLAF